MPSNNALKEEITELAKGLGLEINTDGLNNDKLAALVKDLRAKKKDAETDTQADNAPPVAKPKQKLKPKLKLKPKDGYYLCEGKALTTRRGILSSGAEIKPKDISGGKEALDGFVLSGHVEKG